MTGVNLVRDGVNLVTDGVNLVTDGLNPHVTAAGLPTRVRIANSREDCQLA